MSAVKIIRMFQENVKVKHFISHHFDLDSIQFTTSNTLTEIDTSIKRTVANNLCYLAPTQKNEKDRDFADIRTKQYTTITYYNHF